jgi:hypothetical protein
MTSSLRLLNLNLLSGPERGRGLKLAAYLLRIVGVRHFPSLLPFFRHFDPSLLEVLHGAL